jgi:hypothetical protein
MKGWCATIYGNDMTRPTVAALCARALLAAAFLIAALKIGYAVEETCALP